ncbi:MAG: methyl-accepting chemotaxis protein [Hyphomicrobiales bacterium]|nr:methyl-accepting chemotaxis protein [Hyphomicrobiales bacterium]
MQEINRHTSAIAASVQQQNSATGQISRNVEIAAIGTNAILLVLEEVTGDISEAGSSAETMRTASQSVETAASNLREEVESFLRKVCA